MLDALRKKNALLQAQCAVRGDLDDITVSLTLMRRFQEDYDCLRPAHPLQVQTVRGAGAYDRGGGAYGGSAPLPLASGSEWHNPEDEFLLACRVTTGTRRMWGERKCKQGLHSIPGNTDFCGDCG